MANKSNDLAHTKWVCKYHIVFTPKYRRKIIYNTAENECVELYRIPERKIGIDDI